MDMEKLKKRSEEMAKDHLKEACGLFRAILADCDGDMPHYQEVCAFLGHETIYDVDEDVATCACGERTLTGRELRSVEP